jgi:hypothetical protein
MDNEETALAKLQKHHGSKAAVARAQVGKLEAQYEAAVEELEANTGGSEQMGIDAKKVAQILATAAHSGIKLKKLALGALITGPTIAELGENGPEAVIPLSNAGAMSRSTQPLPSGVGGAGGGLHINQLSIFGANKPNSQLVQELYRTLRPMLQGTI